MLCMVLLFDHPRSGVVYNFGRVSTHKLVYVAHDSEQSVIVRSVLPHLECGTICLSKSSPHRPLPPSNNRSTSDELLPCPWSLRLRQAKYWRINNNNKTIVREVPSRIDCQKCEVVIIKCLTVNNSHLILYESCGCGMSSHSLLLVTRVRALRSMHEWSGLCVTRKAITYRYLVLLYLYTHTSLSSYRTAHT